MAYATRTMAERWHGVETIAPDPSWTRQEAAGAHPERTAQGAYVTARYVDADGMPVAFEVHEDRPYYSTGRARFLGDAEVLPAYDEDGDPIITRLWSSAGIGGYGLGYLFGCDTFCANCAAEQMYEPDADPTADDGADGSWPSSFVLDGDPDEHRADEAGARATLAHLTDEHGMTPEDVAALAGVKDPARLIGSGSCDDSHRMAEVHRRAHALGIMRLVTFPLPLWERCGIAPEGIDPHRPHLGGPEVCRLAAIALAAHTATEPDHEDDDHRHGWTTRSWRHERETARYGIEPEWSEVPYFTCGGCHEDVH